MTTAAIRSFFIDGPAGRLESVLNAGVENATHAAVVCHPHPLFGGTLHNKVVFHAMKALNSRGWPVVRFNFRGTGLSEGQHDHGHGEVDDSTAAINWMHNEFRLPLVFAGFSFGAATGLKAACPDPRVEAVIGLGLPVGKVEDRAYDFSFLRTCTKPKLFVSGAYDQFGSPTQLEAAISQLAPPRELVIIPGADHFFEGKLPLMRETIEKWLTQTIP